MSVSAFGDRAALVQLPVPDDRDAVVRALRSVFPEAVVRAGLTSVLVEQRAPDAALVDAVAAALAGGLADGGARGGPAPRPAVVEVRVDYDGEDLAVVAGLLACRPAEVIAAHVAQEWQVAMMGFAPGFGYLLPFGPRELDWSRIPRRTSPRGQVPPGSVAVAAGMSAIYPSAMPGGWHLLGRTPVPLFDPSDEQNPTLLHPGDRVRFVPAGP